MTDKQKEQSEAKLVGQIQTICDFINNRPETFKGVYGGVGKIITEYAERKEQECEKLKQTLIEIKEIAKEQIPYLNIGEAKTIVEIEYDYAGAICNLEQRMYKILQKISECEVENE